jgi:selenide, water dikinase
LLRIEGRPDSALIEFFFDAQTSGGLLLAVPEDRAAEASDVLARHGTLATARIGEVVEREKATAIVLRS